ncbi:MAG: transcriptional regulator, partial [Bryobacterales bacterium]|nr:transcriptional regulator [Bryobacterales bacterium]
QWDTSDHDWLEGRGEKLYLITMIDDATSRLMARFVRSDSTEENMRSLWTYLGKNGRPQAFYTDKASLFQTTEKRKR